MIDLKEYEEGRFLLFATRNGIVKKTALPEYDSPRTGLIAVGLKKGDELIDVRLTDGDDEVFLVSRGAGDPVQGVARTRVMGRGAAGVIGMRLGEDDRVLTVGLCVRRRRADQRHRTGLREAFEAGRLPGRRPRRQGSHRAPACPRPVCRGAYVGTKDMDMFVISSSGQVVRVAAADIRRVGRSSQGVRTMRVEDDATVVALARSSGHG